MNNILSEQKLAANRRNALKSTGPRTPRGKAVVSRNALRYGVLAEAVVVRGHVAKESPKEYEQLCREFHESLEPVGLLEEMLTGQIAATAWRLRRVRKAESGEIALSVDEGCRERSQMDPAKLGMAWDMSGDFVGAMQKSKIGNAIIISWLEEVRKQVEQDGELTEESAKISCGGRKNRISEKLEKMRLLLSQRQEGADETERREKVKGQTLRFIVDLINEHALKKEDCEMRERMEEDSRQAAAVLPAEATLGKIMRYESALERQLFRAMNQLERLQERRKKNAGQEPPPEKHETAKQSQTENEKIA